MGQTKHKHNQYTDYNKKVILWKEYGTKYLVDTYVALLVRM